VDLFGNLQMLVSGLSMGAIYALVALGFVLIFNAVSVVNFAQGELVMLPAFIATALLASLSLPFALVYAVVLAVTAVFGLVFQRIAYYPLRYRGYLPFAISTIGVGIFLKNAAQVMFGPEPRLMARPMATQSYDLAGVFVDPQHIVIIVITAVLLVALYWFFEKTLLGKMMQATAQDKEMARLLGIRTQRMIALTFMLSSGLAAVAGVLVGPIFYVTKEMGGTLGLKAFCATIIGGFGSVPGAILGGLFIGVVEVFSAYYISSGFREGFAFIVLILFLVVRPQGFFGEKIAEKA
jgi:branched-chain amino acid transport system permease protein